MRKKLKDSLTYGGLYGTKKVGGRQVLLSCIDLGIMEIPILVWPDGATEAFPSFRAVGDEMSRRQYVFNGLCDSFNADGGGK